MTDNLGEHIVRPVRQPIFFKDYTGEMLADPLLSDVVLRWLHDEGYFPGDEDYMKIRKSFDQCGPGEPAALDRQDNHHELVRRCVESAVSEGGMLEGRLGSPRSVRRKVYERLKSYHQALSAKKDLFAADTLQQLDRAIGAIYEHQLRNLARDAFGRQLRLGISDEDLAQMAIDLYAENRLCIFEEQEDKQEEPKIVCSIGLKATEG